jgi:hypothetical protein
MYPSVLALSKRNPNATEIILFLHRLSSVCRSRSFDSVFLYGSLIAVHYGSSQVLIEYFKELEEESIRDNFVIIYELLDEMMDFGYPQTTESKILQESATAQDRSIRFLALFLSTDMLGISLKSLINWKFRPDLLPPLLMPCRGDQKEFDTAKMRYFWTLSKVSICW